MTTIGIPNTVETQFFEKELWTPACRVSTVESTANNVVYDLLERSHRPKVSNPMDEFGFRSPSPYWARETAIKHGVGSVEWESRHPSPSTQGDCAGKKAYYSRLTGALDASFNNVYMSKRSYTGAEQTNALLAMRAESELADANLNVLQFAAFIPSTLRTIASDVRKLKTLLHIAGNVKSLRAFFKVGEDPRSLYLRWLFVYNQLYRDILNSVEFLQSKTKPEGFIVRGTSTNSYTEKYSGSPLDVWSRIQNSVSSRAVIAKAIPEGQIEMSQRAVSYARITNRLEFTANSVGLLNPAYLAWDLVKWSWVVDQLVDVGAYINSLTSMHGLEFLGTSITTRVVNSCTLSYVPVETNQTITTNVSVTPSTSKRKWIDREVRKNPTQTITVRNPFQTSTKINAAVVAALSMEMHRQWPKIKAFSKL